VTYHISMVFLLTPWLAPVWALAAVPPLTDTQQTQLATARDDVSIYDEAALYPLLENAARWPDGLQAQSAGARVPDFNALRDSPETYRGEVFLIEGRFMRRRRVERLARPDLVDGTLSEWAIQTGPDGSPAAIVLLVDPPERQPLVRTRVRTVARFFKWWSTTANSGEKLDFPVFVGRSVAVVDPGGRAFSTEHVVILVLIAAGMYWLLKKKAGGFSLTPQPLPARRLRPRAPREALDALAAGQTPPAAGEGEGPAEESSDGDGVGEDDGEDDGEDVGEAAERFEARSESSDPASALEGLAQAHGSSTERARGGGESLDDERSDGGRTSG